MTSSIHSHNEILIIGAGELGLAIMQALIEKDEGNARLITVLLRPPNGSVLGRDSRLSRYEDVRIVYADIATETINNLATVFRPFDLIICCTGFVGGSGTQRKITSAVLQSGAKRYVPWQFGIDYDIVGRGSGQEVFDEQSEVRDILRSQSTTDWVIISTGMFTSFLFEPSFGLVDLKNGKINALGSWENKLTVTSVEDIGKLTALILSQEPVIKNKVVFIAGDTFTYAELADILEKTLGRSIERTLWDQDLLRAEVAAHPNDGMRKYRLAFARDTGVAWDKELTFNAEQNIGVIDVTSWLVQATKR